MSLEKPFWSVHTHSRYSAKDALPKVPTLVEKAAAMGYPALALTDHGTVSGVVQLYKSCRKAGIEPLPGIELYVTPDYELGDRKNKHLTVVSYSETGYRNLVKLSNYAQSNFWYKPRVDMAVLAGMAEDAMTQGLAVSTGCYFGVLIQTLLTQGPRAAERVVETLTGWFPRVYVELQNHGIDHPDDVTDDDIVRELVAIADRVGVPYLIAQDSHYITRDEQPLHDAMKRMMGFGDDPDEAVFPGDGYHLVDRRWLKSYFEPEVLDRAIDNLTDLAERSSVRLPELESFQMKVPDVTVAADPYEELERRVLKAMREIYVKDKPMSEDPAYTGRAEEELKVIEIAGMAGYLLLVDDVCEFMTERGIWFHARGSAAGSLICNVLGITQADPVRWGLRMDRFLSPDRTRPPDIDLDVEHERRDEVVEWLDSRFAVRQVGSHMQMGLTSEEGEEDSGKGSLLVKYFTARNKQNPDAAKIEWSDIPPEDRTMLKKLAEYRLVSGPGTHAAGYIVAPDEDAVTQLPLTWMANRKAMVTAYGKKDVEALGFVKLDLLGLRTLTALKIACQLIVDNPANIGEETWQHLHPMEFYESIPEKDKATFNRIAAGATSGVFQLEGFAMSKGCKELKPKALEDIMAAQALFRPATMKSGATSTYISRRKDKKSVPERHEDIVAETKDTYGILLYQEQVIGVMRRMGMPPAELTDMLDAVKASNEGSIEATKELEAAKPRIAELGAARGWSEDDIEWLNSALAAYGEYSFNKAHACQYGMVAYRTAYLAENYTLEFWTGMLNAYADHDKEGMYLRAARSYEKLRILPAHVNRSQISYTLDREFNAIRRGLISIKGIGAVTAAEIASKAPFTSLSDLGQRVLPSRCSGSRGLLQKVPPHECGGAIAALAEARALDNLEP